MDAFTRHRLVWLHADAWARLRAMPGQDAAQACIALWADRGHPLVVVRQDAVIDAGRLALGLPAPRRWGRLRLRLQVERAEVMRTGHFPLAADVTPLLAPATRVSWSHLLADLADAGIELRAYGSHGWQCLTGEPCLHAGSDLDLLASVGSAVVADQVCARLQQAGIESPRLDGELIFPDHAAVAWREWAAWRSGGAAHGVLVKRLGGVALEHGEGWFGNTALEQVRA